MRDVATFASHTIIYRMISLPPRLLYAANFRVGSPGGALFSFDGFAETELAPLKGLLPPLHSDGEYLYWLKGATGNPNNVPAFQRDGAIFRVALTGGKVEVVASGLPFGTHYDFALRDAELVFLDDEGLHAVPKAGGTPSLLFAATDLVSIASADSSAVLLTSLAAGCYFAPGCPKGSASVFRLPAGANTLETIASVAMEPIVDGSVALVNGEVIYLFVTRARSAVAGVELFLLYRGRVERLSIDPEIMPIGVQHGFLIVGRRTAIIAMCVPVRRRAVAH